MIAQNPVVRSVLIVFAFWYVVFFVLAGFHQTAPWAIVKYMPYALITLFAGASIGILVAVGTRAFRLAKMEEHLGLGDSLREARISIGDMPNLPSWPRAALPTNFLEGMPWWSRIATQFPLHAAAIRAVLEAMHVEPRLPASAVPGGHGGRTLITHSLAVAGEVVRLAPKWEYTGQRTKGGKIRYRLIGEKPHRFGQADVGLLLLTGLAHDIGKVAVYKPAGQGQGQGSTVAVRELSSTHDREGAQVLRQLPEVMALPYEDRTALLMAVGYYHHAFALPDNTWVDDRIRSLTELLIVADIAVGTKEGHSLANASYASEEEEWVDGGPEDAPSTDVMAQLTGVAVESGDGPTINFEALLGKKPQATEARPQQQELPRTAQAAAPRAPAKAPAAAAATAAVAPPAEQEMRWFFDVIRRPGAINGRAAGERIAWKHKDTLYVMDKPLRQHVAARNDMPISYNTTHVLEDQNGNASLFTAALARQLKAYGALIDAHDGISYAPERSLFKMITPNGAEVPVLMVRAGSVPGAGGVPDAKPVTIGGPLWGEHSGKRKAAAETKAAAGTGAPAEVTAAPADEGASDPLLSTARHTSPPASPPAAPAVGGGALMAPPAVDDDDLADMPFGDDAPLVPLAGPVEPEPSAGPICGAELLAELVMDPAFAYPVEWREKGGQRLAVIPLDSDGGRALSETIEALTANGADVSAIQIRKMAGSDARAYVIPVSGSA